jgi:dihydropteridine reductase
MLLISVTSSLLLLLLAFFSSGAIADQQQTIESKMSLTKRVLVYGGRGALGSACVKAFKQSGWWVGSIDLNENTEANANIILSSVNDWQAQEKELLEKAASVIGDTKVDAIICVAGGWAGGNAASNDFIKNTDLMIKQSVWSSALSAKLASKYLTPNGLLTLTGAKAALDGTSGMIGYGLAKAAVHHLTKSLAAKGSGLPEESSVLAILPITLDTESNRKWMKGQDQTSWTPLSFIASLFGKWISEPTGRPTSGSLVQLITKDSETSLKID